MTLDPGTVHSVVVTIKDMAGNIAMFDWGFTTTMLVEFKGQVIGADGQPIAGATVTAGNYSCITDEHGNFSLLAPYNVGRAEVTAAGKTSVSIDLSLTELGMITMTTGASSSSWMFVLLVVAVVAMAAAGYVLLRKRRRI